MNVDPKILDKLVATHLTKIPQRYEQSNDLANDEDIAGEIATGFFESTYEQLEREGRVLDPGAAFDAAISFTIKVVSIVLSNPTSDNSEAIAAAVAEMKALCSSHAETKKEAAA